MWNSKWYVDIEQLPGYEINKQWVIKNKKTGVIRKLCIWKRGYKVIDVKIKDKYRLYYVHRLVAETFIPNPLNLPEVNHIDWDKTNNKVSNLERVTSSQNAIHWWRTWLRTYDNRDKRKAVVWFDKDWKKIYEFASLAEAARVLWLSRWDIGNVCRGVWKTHWWIIRKFANDTWNSTD